MSKCPVWKKKAANGQSCLLGIKRNQACQRVSMIYPRIAVHVLDHFHSLKFAIAAKRMVPKVVFPFLGTCFAYSSYIAGTEKPEPICEPSQRSLTNCRLQTSERRPGQHGRFGRNGLRWRGGSCLRFGLSPLTHFPTSSTSHEFPSAISSFTFSLKINGVNQNLLANWMSAGTLR